MKTLTGFFLGLLLGTPFLHAQDIGGVWQLDDQTLGAAQRTGFGVQLAFAGDLNGDGVEDLAIAAPGFPGGSRVGPGAVFLLSGADRSVIRRLDAVPGGNRDTAFGLGLANPGDVNGDGIDDLLVGAYASRVPPAPAPGNNYAGEVFLFSGADGALLWKMEGTEEGEELGLSVAGIGDLDGDGLPDVAVGANLGSSPFPPPYPGRVFLLRGSDGSVLRILSSSVIEDRFGRSVAGPGDLNGDGWPDVLVGVPSASTGNGGSGVGVVLLISGKDGTILRKFEGPSPSGSTFGLNIKVIGDLNADGLSEWACYVIVPSASGPDLVDIFDGASGNPLAQLAGSDSEEFFGCTGISPVGDANGNGTLDLLIGARNGAADGRGRPGAAYLFSGDDFHLIHRFTGDADGDQFGSSLLLGKDLDGDGNSEIVVGAFSAQSDLGTVDIFGFLPGLEADATRISASAGGTVHFDLDFPDSESGFRYGLLLSLGTGPTTVQGVRIPLSKDRWFRRSLEQRAPAFFTPAFGRLDPLGDAQVVYSPPPGALIKQIGRTFHLAAVTRDTNRRLSVSSVEVPLTIDP